MTSGAHERPSRSPGEAPLFLRACRREPVERTPIWIMRQAGRYLPEYRELRAKVDFLTSCRTPEVACELTLQPVRRLGVDAAILFSDILIPLPGMGVPVAFDPGPVIDEPVRSRPAIERLRVPDAREATPYVLEAVRLLRRELSAQVPLIGFAGSPFTVATYLVEGGGSKSFSEIKSLLFTEPALAHLLLSKCADTIASYLVEQVRAGAQAAMLFDTWAGILAPDDYRTFALPYARRVFERVARTGDGVPRIYYAGESAGYIDMVAGVGADVIGIDWRMSLAAARPRLGPDLAVQGNLDPAVLLGPRSLIESRVSQVLLEAAAAGKETAATGADGAKIGPQGWREASAPVQTEPGPRGPTSTGGPGEGVRSIRSAPGHIFNLGHGIQPSTPAENALFLVETVQRLTSAPPGSAIQ